MADEEEFSPSHDGLHRVATRTKSRCLRVLVVEDEPTTADALAGLHSLEVQTARDGTTALRECPSGGCGALDICLPGAIDGHEVARQLLRQEATAYSASVNRNSTVSFARSGPKCRLTFRDVSDVLLAEMLAS
jgi:CheY-like chemotaxis protein